MQLGNLGNMGDFHVDMEGSAVSNVQQEPKKNRVQSGAFVDRWGFVVKVNLVALCSPLRKRETMIA
jgi:hypothetical protein